MAASRTRRSPARAVTRAATNVFVLFAGLLVCAVAAPATAASNGYDMALLVVLAGAGLIVAGWRNESAL